VDTQLLIDQLKSCDSLVRGAAIDAIVEEGTPNVEVLYPLLDDPDPVVRFKVACALAEWHDNRGLPLLIGALAIRELCFMALEALLLLGAPEAVPELKRFFGRRFLHPIERLQAAAALYRSGEPSALDFIRECLTSRKQDERGMAIELWGRLQQPGARDLLEAILADPDDAQRLDAVRGLEMLNDPRSLALLDRVAADPQDEQLAEAARAAADALRRMNE
jgi:HEAT repeat protein